MMTVLMAFGLAIAFEGAAYALFPDKMRRAAQSMLSLGDDRLRLAGAATFAVGALIVLAGRAFG